MGKQVEHSNRRRSIVALVWGVIALAASLFIPYGGLLGVYGIILAVRVGKGAHSWVAVLGMLISILAIVWMLFAFLSPALPDTFPFSAIIHTGSSSK